MLKSLIAAALIITQAHASVESAESVVGTVQFCWATGLLDNTVYYAEASDREDRSRSFDELLDISGIEHSAVTCFRKPIDVGRAMKLALLKEWQDSELEVVDTTFMSDLDY